MNTSSTHITKELNYFFQPITESQLFDSSEAAFAFFKQWGLDIENLLLDPAAFLSQVNTLTAALKEWENIAFEDFSVEQIPTIINATKNLFNFFKSMDGLKLLKEVDLPDDNFPRYVFDLLLIRYLEVRKPGLASTLKLFNLLQYQFDDASNIVHASIRWDQLYKIVSAPDELLKEATKWGTRAFVAHSFLEGIKDVLTQLGIYSYFEYLTNTEYEFFENKDGEHQRTRRLKIPFIASSASVEPQEWGLMLYPVSNSKPSDSTGLLLQFYTTDVLNTQISIDERWTIQLDSNMTDQLPVGILLEPQKINLLDTVPGNQKTELPYANLVAKQKTSDPIRLFGTSDSTRLEVNDFGIKIGFNTIANQTVDFNLGITIDQIRFVLANANQDGLISKLLPANGLQSEFSLALTWSPTKGIGFNGTAGLQYDLPIYATLGPLTISGLSMAARLSASNLAITAASDFNTRLGPLMVGVHQLGVEAIVRIDQTFEGNLGFFEVDLKVLPPSGAMIDLDMEVVKGGGFLSFDPSRKEYAGMLSLSFEILELTATGVVTTQLPNGKNKVSVLIAINTLFNPAFQLSFGFTLNGVGGILGYNRTINTVRLRQQFNRGKIDQLMFPKNPIQNAKKIISHLNSVFPPKEGHTVFAPLLKIGWGTPAMVEIDLGIVLRFPFNNRLFLLGKIGIRLPQKGNRLVDINVDVFGDFNFAESNILLLGRIQNSQVVGIRLSGDFGFMMDWGKKRQFLFSIGGYHPRYRRPNRFPALRRLTATIKRGRSIVLTCAYYQALTSNTFQIGASASLVARKGRFSLSGRVGFDALFYFNPFRFTIGMRISVSVKYKRKNLAGVGLRFNLSGPKPWHAIGNAKIRIIVKIKIPFNFKWGGGQRKISQTKSAASLVNELQNQFASRGNWSAIAPYLYRIEETLNPLSNADDHTLLIHPNAGINVRQTLLPLNFKLNKFGNYSVPGGARFSVHSVKVDGKKTDGVLRKVLIKEDFALAQYRDHYSDKEKLALNDFYKLPAGLTLQNRADFDLGQWSPKTTDSIYEDILLDEELSTITPEKAVSKNAISWEANQYLRNKGARINRFKSENETFKLEDDFPVFNSADTFVIVDNKNLKPPEEMPSDLNFETYEAAADYVSEHLPQLSDQLQIMKAVDLEMLKSDILEA